jgi:hypothetical protein
LSATPFFFRVLKSVLDARMPIAATEKNYLFDDFRLTSGFFVFLSF